MLDEAGEPVHAAREWRMTTNPTATVTMSLIQVEAAKKP